MMDILNQIKVLEYNLYMMAKVLKILKLFIVKNFYQEKVKIFQFQSKFAYLNVILRGNIVEE